VRATDVSATRDAARGHWLEILARLAPSLSTALQRHPRHVACPQHGGKDGFRFFRDVADSGGGICNTCGSFHDGFALLQWVNGWTFPHAVSEVASHLNIFITEEAVGSETPVDAAERVRRIWREAKPDAGRISSYLVHRGLSGVVPASLRLHPSLPYYNPTGELLGHFQAMVAPVQSPVGELVAIHRTYLAYDGPGKAPVPTAKKLTPAVRPGATMGAAIRLAPLAETVNITEGIETGLAVMEHTLVPTLATVAAGGLVRFEPPVGVRVVHIWADNDLESATGQRAQAQALRNLRLKGYFVEVHIPTRGGSDWLDVFAGH
jgi:putative DNA primase/helicase